MDNRAIRDFEIEGEIWPYLDGWSRLYNYQYVGIENNGRLYKRSYLRNAPTMLFVSQDGQRVHLEAWVKESPIGKMFRGVPVEMTVANDGDTTYLATRSLGRSDVNILLWDFKQPPIR